MPPRKRKATQQADDQQTANAEENGEEQVQNFEEPSNPPPAVASAVEERKRKDRELARRRAAHFATWDGGADNAQTANNETAGADGVHAGGSNARELGPWSSAVQLANARKEEKEKRENKILNASRGTTGQKTREVSIWTPSRDPSLGPRNYNNVPLLFQITTRLVVDLIEDVDTLLGLPDLVKICLATEVSKRRALNPTTLRLFVENNPSEICLPNCSNLDPDVILPGILEACTPKLEKLELRLVGRGMTDAVATSLSSQGVLSSLKHLCLTGAYRLNDQGLMSLLVATNKGLLSLGLPLCSRITGLTIESLPELTPNLKQLNLSECRGLSSDTIKTAILGLPQLESLILDGISSEIDDSLLGVIGGGANGGGANGGGANGTAALPLLTSLSLAACPRVTSAGLTNLVTALPKMRKLGLSECLHVDAATVIKIASTCKYLEEISLERCIAVDDEAVSALSHLDRLQMIDLSGVIGLTEVSVIALAKNGAAASLQHVDLSWCRGVSPESLGLLADSCRNLKTLVLWGCSQVDDSDFILGHSNDNLLLIGRD